MAHENVTGETEPLKALEALVDALRGENGCPWDRKQTPQSMRVYVVEEAFELAEALERGEDADVAKELGDVLFQVFFLCRIFRERGLFDIRDVAAACVEKMIGRHPHVFGQDRADTAEEVRRRWHEFKKKETPENPQGVLSSIPRTLPSLMRAYRVWERAKRTGFASPSGRPLAEEAEDRFHELADARDSGDPARAEKALGELLFALAGAAWEMGVHPDTALSNAVNGFAERFERMEQTAGTLEGRTEEDLRDRFAQAGEGGKV